MCSLKSKKKNLIDLLFLLFNKMFFVDVCNLKSNLKNIYWLEIISKLLNVSIIYWELVVNRYYYVLYLN